MKELRPRRPKNVTRASILAKACEMYLAGQLAPGDERLATVLDVLGYTTGAGYQIWNNQSHFREDLQTYIAQNLEWRARIEGPTTFDDLAAFYADPDAPWFHALRWVATHEYQTPELTVEAVRDGFKELARVAEATLDIKDKAELREATALLIGRAVLAKVNL